MKGRMTKVGSLEIFRGNKYKAQGCTYDNEDCNCGDWCSLFGEPIVSDTPGNFSILSLCKKELWFEEFTDERQQTEEADIGQ